MKILHLIISGPDEISHKIMEAQGKSHELKIIDVPKDGISYESLVEDIFHYDRVISW